MSVEYTLHTKSNGTITAVGNQEPPNSIVVGDTYTYSFYDGFRKGDHIYAQDATIETGESVKYDTVTVQEGVTLTINGTLTCKQINTNGTVTVNGTLNVVQPDELTILDTYREWGGKYTTNRMIDGTVKYKDRFPTSVGIDSLVIGVEPSADLKANNVNGLWGIISSITNQRNATLNVDRYAIQIFALAPFDDYADVTSVENALRL